MKIVLSHECPKCHEPVHVTKRERYGAHGSDNKMCSMGGKPVAK